MSINAYLAAAGGIASLICCITAILSFRLGRRHSSRPAGLSLTELAARAEANGMDLLRIAREIERACDGHEPVPQVRLRRWARTLRQVGAEHLECINAIALQSLREAGAERSALHHADSASGAVQAQEAALRSVSHV
ncbi:hypothetical protein DYQ93_11620 [Xanthomonas sp. LMG 8992]|uniref:hypothetical protein n=1 Tax=Xanthomonas sp. LMG 8992 TaxID=1591157 RepID=UPI00136E5CB1|nr:hypothetical protein [Xanthomonas sp. LMG 8992]MXV11669.1 hypothetical protein [Xanthomonas sp. LMG 8992]